MKEKFSDSKRSNVSNPSWNQNTTLKNKQIKENVSFNCGEVFAMFRNGISKEQMDGVKMFKRKI